MPESGPRAGLSHTTHRTASCSDVTSPFSARPAIPPLAGRLIPHDACGDVDGREVAELPQLLRRSRVLKDDLVDLERVDLARPEACDGWLDATDELAELLLVIGSNGLARGPMT